MKNLYIVGGLLLITVLIHLFIRKDVDENKRLTQKGKIKLGLSLFVIMLSTIITIVLVNGK
ncbi:DUF3976 domain-containing protein [Bacillus sp. WMMC1349]|nr:DUF3976 domain-containing protein [Bacillus sp. WMMC1349]